MSFIDIWINFISFVLGCCIATLIFVSNHDTIIIKNNESQYIKEVIENVCNNNSLKNTEICTDKTNSSYIHYLIRKDMRETYGEDFNKWQN